MSLVNDLHCLDPLKVSCWKELPDPEVPWPRSTGPTWFSSRRKQSVVLRLTEGHNQNNILEAKPDMTYGPGKIIKWLTVLIIKHLYFFYFLFIIHIDICRLLEVWARTHHNSNWWMQLQAHSYGRDGQTSPPAAGSSLRAPSPCPVSGFCCVCTVGYQCATAPACDSQARRCHKDMLGL